MIKATLSHTVASAVALVESKSKRGPNGCIEWTGGKANCGYGRISVGGKMYRTHRLMFEHRVGPIPPGLHVLHKCDNPPCWNPEHLFLGTENDNAQDRMRKGRHRVARGEEYTRTRLTVADVRALRAAYAKGEAIAPIARRLGVNRATAADAARGINWGWLDGFAGIRRRAPVKTP